MTKDIVSKLRNHLAEPIHTECATVYLLAEVRKLLERDDPKQRNGALWMHCHWALHVDLHSPNTTLEFLKFVDLWVTNTVSGLLPRGAWKPLQEHYLLRDFVYLDTFRSQLRAFLAAYGLPTGICDRDDWWFTFLSYYAGVIEDGCLTARADKDNELGAVKQVTFTKGKSLPSEHHVNFVIKWDIELKDGRILETEVESRPVHRMMSYHLTLKPATIAAAR